MSEIVWKRPAVFPTSRCPFDLATELVGWATCVIRDPCLFHNNQQCDLTRTHLLVPCTLSACDGGGLHVLQWRCDMVVCVGMHTGW